jgi:hypothetical protein
MKNTIPFELEDGTIVHIETTDAATGAVRVGRGGQEEKAAKRFKDALAHVKPAAETVLDAFKGMNEPAEIGLEFGLKFSAKLGTAVIASVDGEAAFKVSLKWTNPKPAPPAATPADPETAPAAG